MLHRSHRLLRYMKKDIECRWKQNGIKMNASGLQHFRRESVFFHQVASVNK